MNRISALAKRAAFDSFKLAFAPVVCTCLVLLWLTPLRNQTRQTVQSFGKVAMKANDSFVDQQAFWKTALPKTLGKVNDDLDAAHDTIVKVGDTSKAGTDLLVSVRGASDQAKSTMQQIGVQMAATNADAQKLVQAATKTADSTTATLDEATKTEHDLDALVANPDWAKIGANFQAGTKDGAGILKDVRIETDKFVKPRTKWQKVEAVVGFGSKIAICKMVGIGCTI